MVNRGSTSTAEQLEGLGMAEVLSMLRFGADRIFRNEAGAGPSDQELDQIMDRWGNGRGKGQQRGQRGEQRWFRNLRAIRSTA